jgi:hypothetical protein
MIGFMYRTSDWRKTYEIRFQKTEWKGRNHGRVSDHEGSNYATFHYKYFTFTRTADVIDTILYYLKNDPNNVPNLVSWNGSKSLTEMLEKEKEWILSPRRYRKYLKRFKKLKILKI